MPAHIFALKSSLYLSLSPSLTCTTALNHTPGSFKLQAHAAVITRIEAISGTQIDLGLRFSSLLFRQTEKLHQQLPLILDLVRHGKWECSVSSLATD
ncbi:hypothetical protein NL676_002686 [Syzygium grande]|nr:hypothetical protein NL676_002686 [Syzygium grande]